MRLPADARRLKMSNCCGICVVTFELPHIPFPFFFSASLENLFDANFASKRIISVPVTLFVLEPVCCKKQQKKSWPVTGLWIRGPLKDLNDYKLIVYESKWFPWSFRINFIPFRIFTGPLFHKPVTGQELFLLFLTNFAAIQWRPLKMTLNTTLCKHRHIFQ